MSEFSGRVNECAVLCGSYPSWHLSVGIERPSKNPKGEAMTTKGGKPVRMLQVECLLFLCSELLFAIWVHFPFPSSMKWKCTSFKLSREANDPLK